MSCGADRVAHVRAGLAGRGWWVSERAMAGVIAVNAGVLVAGLVIGGHDQVFDQIHDGIAVIFLIELAARLRMNGWRFLRRPVNAFDAAVILVSALPVAGGVDASLLRVARLARLVHFAKHAGHLRLLRRTRQPTARPE